MSLRYCLFYAAIKFKPVQNILALKVENFADDLNWLDARW